MFVYTKYAEKFAKDRRLDERKAGTIAKIGGEILTDGMIARAWIKHGFIEEINDKPGND